MLCDAKLGLSFLVMMVWVFKEVFEYEKPLDGENYVMKAFVSSATFCISF
jgi:hypothetical protein